MFDLGKVECTTALEVELLAALVHERRLRSRIERPPAPEQPKSRRFTFLPPPRARDFSFPAEDAGIKDIQAAVAEQFHVAINDILSQRRDAYTCLARHAAIVLCHALTSHSYPAIAREFAGRDHTTMLNSIRKYRDVQLELAHELNKSDTLANWAYAAFKKMMGRAKPNLPRYHESVA